MRVDPAHLAQARKVADAILYEGYLLYPYHQTAQKNQARFQFGVLMPPAYGAVDDCELTASQTECLLECPDAAQVRVLVRFLQMRHRIVQAVTPPSGDLQDVAALAVDTAEYTTWDEATEREQWAAVTVADLLSQDRNVEFHIGAGEASEDLVGSTGKRAGRLVYRWNGISGVIRLGAQRVAGPFGALRLRVRVENDTIPETPVRSRHDGLQHAMIGAHALIWVPGGKFLSMTEPPEWAAAEVAACVNIGTWPVLAGPRECHDLLLSSPVILYDHPEIAAESPGELFDATEIDEILTLRTLALTDAEKQQARVTDPRAAQIMDRLADMPPEMLERMHGAIRYLKAAPGGPGADPAREAAREQAQWPPRPAGAAPVQGTAPDRSAFPGGQAFPGGPAFPGQPALPGQEPGAPSVPWWDPGSDGSVSPETDCVVIAGVRVARGSRVRMRPGSRRADAQDLFLIGREATVEAVLHDVDGQVHVAVSPENDPAADLQRSHGRFLYFAPDEIEPIDGQAEPVPPAEPPGPRGDQA